MLNEFDTNKNQLDLFDYAELKSRQQEQDRRQNLASSGFTASVWTLSGVVLAACGIFDDDEGGNALYVQKSPVQGARLYFDLDNDGDIDADDMATQDALFPQGIVTDSSGRANNVPAIFQGLPFKAVLDGAIDADTGVELSGELFSIPAPNGAHRLASPITDLIVDDGRAPEEVIAALLPDADSAEIARILEAINDPRSYLGGHEGVEGFTFYLASLTDPGTPEEINGDAEKILNGVATDPTDPNRDTLIIVNEIVNGDADSDPTYFDLPAKNIGAYDSYVAKIQAVSHAGAVAYQFVDANGAPADVSDFSINAQGIISFIGEAPTTTTLHIEVSNDDSAETEIVRVVVTVAPAPVLNELPAGAESATIMEGVEGAANGGGTVLISGITTTAPLTNPTWKISEVNPAGLSAILRNFEIVEGEGDTYNLVLKSGESLDYEAIPGGVLNLHLWVKVGDGDEDNKVRSNPLELRIQVENNPDEIDFSGDFTGIVTEDGNLVAQGTIRVENQPENAYVTVSNSERVSYGHFDLADNGTWTYTLYDDIPEVDALQTGQVLIDTATITLDTPDGDVTQKILIRINGRNEDVRFVDGDGNRITRDVAAEGIEIGLDATNGVSLGDVVPEIRGLLRSNDDSNVVLADDMGGLFSLDPATGILTFTGTAAEIAGLNGGANLALVLTAPASIGDEEVRLALTVNVINEDDNGRAEYEITGDVEVGQVLTVSMVQGADDPDGIVGGGGGVSFQWFRGDERDPTLLRTGERYRVTQNDIDSGDSIGVFAIYTDGSSAVYTHADNDDATTIFAFATPVSFTGPAPADRTINLAEDTAASNTPHFTVQATSENDTGAIVDIARYELLDENREAVSNYKGFEIDSTSGAITLTGALDYETTPSITLRVRATDMNSPAETATITLTVNVGDVNEHAPVFTQSTYTAEIAETLAVDAEVVRVSARDADGTAENSTVTYSITGGNTGNVFDINPSSGVITLLNPLDYETATEYTLEITASDGTLTDTATVTINIRDINDESPSVPNPAPTGTARVTAAADNPAGTGMGYRISVSDADAVNDFDVDIIAGDDRFEFRRQTGTNTWELFLDSGEEILLSELGDTITLGYRVTDGGAPRTTPAEGTVTLTVVDTPVAFTAPDVVTIPLDENNAADLAVATVTAESEDSDGNDVFIQSFALIDDFNGLFSISTSGAGTASASASITIASANALNFEATESYALRVVATDTAGETNTLTLTVNVVNVDESGEATYGIHEPSSGVLALDPAAFVDDPDGVARIISYQWWSNVSGTETVISDADRETFNIPPGNGDSVVYRVDIEYEDGFGATKTVTARTSSVSFDANMGRQTISWDEFDTITNAASVIGTAEEVANVAATSVTPGAAVSYDVTGGDDIALFRVHSTSGVITLLNPLTLDFEMKESYEVVITATDSITGDTAEARITIQVINNQEGDGTYIIEGNVAAGATLRAVVDDPDGTQSTTYEWYSVDSAGENRQEHGGTQEIRLDLNADLSRTYYVEITHIDNLSDPHTETLKATAVEFGQNSYSVSPYEGTDTLTTVSATLTGATLTYAFLTDRTAGTTATTQGIFTIDATTGAISLVTGMALDYETTPTHALTVRATEQGGTTFGDVQVTINVRDVNEADPVIAGGATATATISEGANAGAVLTTVMATDTDPTNTLTYRIAGGTGASLFTIADASSGEITLIGALDRETTDEYTLVVTVTDDGVDNTDTAAPRTSAPQTITVTVTDVNDTNPMLSTVPVWESTYASGVSAGTKVGTHLFTVTATDDDENPSLNYEIVSVDGVAYNNGVPADGSTAIFGINAGNGQVELAQILNLENAQSHKIVIRAVDEGGRASMN